MHEYFTREEQAVSGSARSFALVTALALAFLGGINWWHDGHGWPWLGGTAVLLLILGYFCPSILKPLNVVWFKFGLLLHAIVNPIAMGLVFYGAVVPTGFVMRAIGKDPLRLKIEFDRDSYWIRHQPPGPAPQSMKDQF